MYETTYLRPVTLAEATQLLQANPEAKLLSGGQTLIPTLKQRLASPSHLVDIGQLAELQGISLDGDKLVVGAASKHADVAMDETVRKAIPGLAQLAGMIGDPQVRHMGTIGGSVANSDPAADYPAAVLGLGASVQTSRRVIPADQFFTGLFETALAADEIIIRIAFPIPRRSAYEKFRNKASRYALVGVFVAEMWDGTVRVAVTGAGPMVFRASALEAALKSSFTPQAAEGVKMSDAGLNSDMHASAEFRAHLVPLLAGRAVAAAH